MSVLLLKIAGPMQSWGDSSRFARRATRREPTKSGIVGLIASALGRGREASIDDLAQLEMGVRTEQGGHLLRDFQTERWMDEKKNKNKNNLPPLSNRYYLVDACFLVALGGDDMFLRQIDAALKAPRWPLYLGRRSCPPTLPLSLGVHEEYRTVREALEHEPWHASERYKTRSKPPSDLEVVCDAHDGEQCESQADYPLSFSATGRRYACRPVVRYRVSNPDMPANCSEREDGSSNAAQASSDAPPLHDPLSWI